VCVESRETDNNDLQEIKMITREEIIDLLNNSDWFFEDYAIEAYNKFQEDYANKDGE
jgi:hypothetical protein